MDYTFILIIQALSSVAMLVLLSIGLAIMFGMMKVINFAHGEFLMIGAYTSVMSVNAGLNFWIATFFVAPLSVALVGFVVERLIIRHLYGRLIETMLATWGLSLFLIGAVTLVFGNTVTGISAPLGAVEIGSYSTSAYELLLIVLALFLLAACAIFLKGTKAGLVARAAMQNSDITAVLGHEPAKIYCATFVVGSAITGLAGGLIAPLTGVSPSMGLAFVAKAFITVICAGPAVITGTGLVASTFGSINTAVTFLSTPVFGEVALLLSAIVLLRVMPRGFTAKFFRGSL
ncbi:MULTISPECIES: branched-chain amino acid ABC transporter permease [unclassified Mesorhizobium]|uniref:branched-chain amino acid ABC transporter permease n=1 Tax=unclassified Mesorhizobium TaxID=325217 RepID=UPI00112CFA29|nr:MULTISPECIES: branched-chain amino acid ABC transporter permease [unclassified Mesorhizobium]MBZ9811000.1 branched-chain amino acid ABC transporter permease [Mesorhizobium sp. ESP-6-2]TPM27778.1 branched-chain amino acid ABC transporter permease [Mesorhizobium sp. B2-2-2]